MAQMLDEEAGVLVPSGLPSRPEHPVQHPLSEVGAFLGVALDRLGLPDVVVSGLAQDSRRVRPGDLYVARPGEHAHGAAFAVQAAAAGAVAVLTDPAGRERAERAGLPTLVVDDPREVLGRLSAWIYGEPATAMTLLGVTGTNGKTTTTYLLDAALTQGGHRTGLVGTIESRIAGEAVPSARTTPEAPDLHALFAVMHERAVTAAVMEVSSHALTFGRVDGVVFDVAGFTNLTQDHMEIHADLEAYYQAKASLFTPERARLGVINVDDPYGARLAGEATIPVVTVSPSGSNADADWRVRGRRATAYGNAGNTAFDLLGPGGFELAAEIGIPGDFNVANAALALVMLEAAGLEAKTVAPALAAATVPGRMERIFGPDGSAGVVGIVDYAHTPDAIAVALAAVAPAVRGRLYAVFGCGGDRDQAKRPLMGKAAAAGADVAVVTDDNPRSEDAAVIRAAALEGTRLVPEPERAEVVEIAGRREAIRWATGQAGPDDVVVVLGKGHEQGQEIAGVVHPFDDRAEVREALAGERQ